MSRQEDGGEMGSQQERLRHRAELQKVREVHQGNTVDYSRVKATDTGFTKRMGQPAGPRELS